MSYSLVIFSLGRQTPRVLEADQAKQFVIFVLQEWRWSGRPEVVGVEGGRRGD